MQVTVSDVLAFLGELALMVALAMAAGALADGAAAVVLAAALVAALVVVWGRWLAPRAGRRLRPPVRLVAKLAVVLVVSALLALGGRTGSSLLVLVAVGAVFAWSEVGRPGSR